jgi:hypothetical protein
MWTRNGPGVTELERLFERLGREAEHWTEITQLADQTGNTEAEQRALTIQRLIASFGDWAAPQVHDERTLA